MTLAQIDSTSTIEFRLAPLLEDYGISLAVLGVLVVFLALSLVVAFITVLPRLIRFIPARQPLASPLRAANTDELPEETLVVIAAAAAEIIHHPHRVVRSRELTPEDLGWSLEGRIQHHQSHRIPRERR